MRAYVQSSDVTKAGALILHATSHQTIAAIVVAGSASVAGAGVAGVGAAGAGAAAENRISVAVAAFIAGDAGSGITAKTISLTAEDTSTIKSDVGAGAIGAGFGGIAGVGVAIAVALATNEIANDVTASISSATVTASAGGISALAREGATIRALSVSATIAAGGGGIAGVAVAGAGASALNAITNRVLAYGDGGSLKTTSSATTPETPGDVTFEAHDVSLISATIAAVSLAVGGGGVAGVGVSIGVSIAQNRIGPFYNLTSDQFVDPDDGSDPGVTLANGALVRVALTHTHGGDPGAIYKYTGGLSSRTLSTEDYSTGPWEKVTDAAPDDILAYLHDTSVDADGTLTLEATADETITAVTAAGAAAVAGGGIAAVAASGAGSSATNVMTARVMAYIDGDGDGVTADAVGISATDTSTVTALTIAGAFAASVAPTGAAIAIGVSLSTNIVANDVQAYIANADDHVTTSGAVSLSAVSQSAPVLDSNDDPFVLDGVTVDAARRRRHRDGVDYPHQVPGLGATRRRRPSAVHGRRGPCVGADREPRHGVSDPPRHVDGPREAPRLARDHHRSDDLGRRLVRRDRRDGRRRRRERAERVLVADARVCRRRLDDQPEGASPSPRPTRRRSLPSWSAPPPRSRSSLSATPRR